MLCFLIVGIILISPLAAICKSQITSQRYNDDCSYQHIKWPLDGSQTYKNDILNSKQNKTGTGNAIQNKSPNLKGKRKLNRDSNIHVTVAQWVKRCVGECRFESWLNAESLTHKCKVSEQMMLSLIKIWLMSSQFYITGLWHHPHIIQLSD